MADAPNLRNYLGGTADSPCPTGGVFRLWAGRYCGYNDDRAWRLRTRDLFVHAINPTYLVYAKAAHEQDPDWTQDNDAFWRALLDYKTTWNALPIPERFGLPSTYAYRVQQFVSLGLRGDQMVTNMQSAIEDMGGTPPDVEVPEFGDNGELVKPEPATPWPWWYYALGAGGVVVAGTGIYFAATAGEKRKR